MSQSQANINKIAKGVEQLKLASYNSQVINVLQDHKDEELDRALERLRKQVLKNSKHVAEIEGEVDELKKDADADVHTVQADLNKIKALIAETEAEKSYHEALDVVNKAKENLNMALKNWQNLITLVSSDNSNQATEMASMSNEYLNKVKVARVDLQGAEAEVIDKKHAWIEKKKEVVYFDTEQGKRAEALNKRLNELQKKLKKLDPNNPNLSASDETSKEKP